MSFLGGLVKAVAGPVLGGIIGVAGNKMDNSAASSASREANEFTEKQLQNRHQWETQDLEKAGLNRILSANGTPSIGSSAKADVFSSSDAINKGVSNALQASLIKSQIKNLDAQSINQVSQAGSADANAALANANSALSAANQHSVTQNATIKKPLADLMSGVGDFSAWGLKQARQHTSDAYKWLQSFKRKGN